MSAFTIIRALAHPVHKRRRAVQKKTVKTAQSGPGLLPFEDHELLAKGGGPQSEAVSRDKECPKVRNCRENERDHHPDITRYCVTSPARNLLVPFANEVLMTHSTGGSLGSELTSKITREDQMLL